MNRVQRFLEFIKEKLKYELPKERGFRNVYKLKSERMKKQSGLVDNNEVFKDTVFSILEGFIDFEDAEIGYDAEVYFTAEGSQFSGESVRVAVELAKKYPELNPYGKKNEVIRKEGSQFCIHSEKGKRMGCYNTKAKAKKRLQQIHYFSGK